jgi:two-component system response regulator AtoC
MGRPSTAKSPSSILVVDDEPSMLRYLRMLLEVDSYKVETVGSGLAAMERVQRNPAPDVVLLDLLMPQMDGMQTLEQLRQLRPGLKVIMLTCANDPRKAVQAIRLGAHDYLTKPFHKAELDAALKSCLGAPPTSAKATAWDGKVEELGDDSLFVAASPAMQKIRAQALQVANINVPVLLLGESGTGKEVVARLIWKFSARAHRTFMKVNCAALPSELLESELFGFEVGAFTGATRAKPGKFELCDKGTFLLDEIAEMPPGLQAKLLHVLQDQQFSRLGSRSTVRVDVRILAATNVNIEQAITAKKLREDLYYRLNAFTLQLPPLRERKEEIPLLLKQFMAVWADRYARPPLPISQSFIDSCNGYSWPGNIRELENLVKRYLILGDEALVLGELEASGKAPVRSPTAPATPAGAQRGDLKSLVRGLKGEAEAEAIARALEETNWSRKEAARLLNISYKALLYKIRQYGLDRK